MYEQQFTESEKKYMALIGEQQCIEAYKMHTRGNGANTVGEEFSTEEIHRLEYTRFGDAIIDAGRKLVVMQNTKTS